MKHLFLEGNYIIDKMNTISVNHAHINLHLFEKCKQSNVAFCRNDFLSSDKIVLCFLFFLIFSHDDAPTKSTYIILHHYALFNYIYRISKYSNKHVKKGCDIVFI